MSAANQSQLAPVSPILSGAAIGAAQSLQGLVFPFLPIQPVVPTASKGVSYNFFKFFKTRPITKGYSIPYL